MSTNFLKEITAKLKMKEQNILLKQSGPIYYY
jgi:hypothetical protein